MALAPCGDPESDADEAAPAFIPVVPATGASTAASMWLV
jgi:hypothetical protein